MNGNTITLVYKTYKNDLKWIYYSLLSVKKFVTGFDEIIIFCHDVCCGELYALIRNINIECRILPVSYDYHGYLKQMVVKASCFKDVTTKYIIIIDSDSIFNVNCNLHDCILPSGKIEWYYWNNIPTDTDVRVWKHAYESMTKTCQDVHYMVNGFPFVFTTESMKGAYDKFIEIHGVDYNTFCKNGCMRYKINVEEPICGTKGRFLDLAKVFEEFEWLGYYCHNFSADYVFISTEYGNAKKRTQQFWSHGGITDDIKNTIEKILDAEK
jgi:hypothetical protein